MKLSSRILSVTFIVASAFLGIQASQNDSATIDAIPSSRTPLVLYGEQIFLRENCLECHTLRDENETTERVSLDGYGGRRSGLWIYYLLTNPKAVHPYKHPTQKNLTQKTISNTLSIEIFQKQSNFSQDQKTIFFNQLKEQAESITQEIRQDLSLSGDHNKLIDDSEMVALIAFLQQIPSTPDHQAYEDEQRRIYEEEVRRREQIYANPDSLFQSITSDSDPISAGEVLFKMNCVTCHGENAQGWIGPNLTDTNWIYDNARNNTLHLIAYGSETNKMPEYSSKLQPNEIAQIVLFLESIREDDH